MGVFSDNYFDLLSEANAIKKGNKGDELWSEITNVIQEQLIPFVNHYTGRGQSSALGLKYELVDYFTNLEVWREPSV